MDQCHEKQPVLCYVSGHWAYFTTRKLADQWGDDWNDAPYEHNAGSPYEFHESDAKRGTDPWEISKVAWDGEFETPDEGHCNSPYSVQQINAGVVAWLRTSRWKAGEITVIHAGVTLDEFCELIRKGGGKIYLLDKKE